MRCGNWQAAYFLPFDYNIVRIPIAVMVKPFISMPFSLLSVPYLAELVANRAFSPQFFFQIGCGGQIICMGVGSQYPVNGQAGCFDIFDDSIHRAK